VSLLSIKIAQVNRPTLREANVLEAVIEISSSSIISMAGGTLTEEIFIAGIETDQGFYDILFTESEDLLPVTRSKLTLLGKEFKVGLLDSQECYVRKENNL
jgi:hypothetical protein